MRKIIHIDMDCFYAAVEMRDFPNALRGKAVAVGSPSKRGVLTTCNYEARKFGCRSAMPTWKAIEMCPHLVVVSPRFDVYRQEAILIRAIFNEYTTLVEPLSLDEAYLDVSASERYAWDLAKEIRAKIFAERQLTASAGIGPNKLLAKIASDWKKPNGQFAVRPEEIDAFMQPLPIEKLWGIGPKGAEKLHALGIRTCGDLQKESLEKLDRVFGSFGAVLYRQSRGLDERAVQNSRQRKSFSNERTLEEPTDNFERAEELLKQLSEELISDLKERELENQVSKLFVRLKFDDFQKTSHETLGESAESASFLKLLNVAWPRRNGRRVRLIGAGVRFEEPGPEDPQLEFCF